MKVGIIDYEAGNLASLSNAIEYLGYEPVTLKAPSDFNELIHLILPGVGNFGHGMEQLKAKGWDEFILDYVNSKKGYFLGICLGMQLMCDSSEESLAHRGLCLVNKEVKRLIPLSNDERIPHVGWNNVRINSKSPIFKNIPNDSDFYFVHSFALHSSNQEIGRTDYCGGFTSVIQLNELIFGAQFHPEKSSKHGLQFLKNFLEFC